MRNNAHKHSKTVFVKLSGKEFSLNEIIEDPKNEELNKKYNSSKDLLEEDEILIFLNNLPLNRSKLYLNRKNDIGFNENLLEEIKELIEELEGLEEVLQQTKNLLSNYIEKNKEVSKNYDIEKIDIEIKNENLQLENMNLKTQISYYQKNCEELKKKLNKYENTIEKYEKKNVKFQEKLHFATANLENIRRCNSISFQQKKGSFSSETYEIEKPCLNCSALKNEINLISKEMNEIKIKLQKVEKETFSKNDELDFYLNNYLSLKESFDIISEQNKLFKEQLDNLTINKSKKLAKYKLPINKYSSSIARVFSKKIKYKNSPLLKKKSSFYKEKKENLTSNSSFFNKNSFSSKEKENEIDNSYLSNRVSTLSNEIEQINKDKDKEIFERFQNFFKRNHKKNDYYLLTYSDESDEQKLNLKKRKNKGKIQKKDKKNEISSEKKINYFLEKIIMLGFFKKAFSKLIFFIYFHLICFTLISFSLWHLIIKGCRTSLVETFRRMWPFQKKK